MHAFSGIILGFASYGVITKDGCYRLFTFTEVFFLCLLLAVLLG